MNVMENSINVSTRTYLLIACLLIIFALLKMNNQLRFYATESKYELESLTRNMFLPLWSREIDFEGFDNNTGTENGCYLVPNIIHFIKLEENTFSFIEMICILAAFKRQRPELLYIHTNVGQFVGKYWDMIKNVIGLNNVLIISRVMMPELVFGIAMNEEWREKHSSDILRIRILMDFGGIFLNNDMYLVKNLNDFRRYEMTVGWKFGKTMSNDILIAHKSARFLNEYLTSYENDYNPNSGVYNFEVKPTNEILNSKPYLVHRVEEYLGTYNKAKSIYLKLWKNWRDYYSLRLLINHQYFLQAVFGDIVYPVKFEYNNIAFYKNITFYEMVNDLFDPETKMIR